MAAKGAFWQSVARNGHGYLLNCQFHNASMLNGDYPGWWVTALLIAVLQNYQEEQPQSMALSSGRCAERKAFLTLTYWKADRVSWSWPPTN